MDADCLIKLTKSNLKEVVCEQFDVQISQRVKEEIVDDAEGHPDAAVIKANIDTALISLCRSPSPSKKGETEILAVFLRGGYDAICSDDKRFIKRMRFSNIPYLTPAVFIVLLVRNGKLTADEGLEKLDALSFFVSDEEYTVSKAILENERRA